MGPFGWDRPSAGDDRLCGTGADAPVGTAGIGRAIPPRFFPTPPKAASDTRAPASVSHREPTQAVLPAERERAGPIRRA